MFFSGILARDESSSSTGHLKLAQNQLLLSPLYSCSMEILLKTELIYRNSLSEVFREKLRDCTACVVQQCKEKTVFEQCVKSCMEPCVRSKLEFERRRRELLEDIREELVSSCARAEDVELCREKVVRKYRSGLNRLTEDL